MIQASWRGPLEIGVGVDGPEAGTGSAGWQVTMPRNGDTAMPSEGVK